MRDVDKMATGIALIVILVVSGALLIGYGNSLSSSPESREAVCWEKEYQCSPPQPQIA